MSWGTVFECVSAVATGGALVAAMIAARQAKQLFGIESARDEQAKEVERRSHATQISAWAATQIRSGGEPVFGVLVRNSSDDPVYDLRVSCHGFTTEETPSLRCVPPGEYFLPNVDRESSDGSTSPWDHAKPVREIRDPLRPFTTSDERGVKGLTFRDSAGVAWRRASSGELDRADA